MPITGIGGVFFRAADPAALQAWYETHLGIAPYVWQQAAGTTIFQPFARDTAYFPADRHHMMNFRVTDLDGLLSALRAAGVEVITDPAWDSPETGRFARIHDPEGNPVELWEPAP
jgi:glyoxylase I family protein